MGFDGLMLNEHHTTPFCMGGVMNVEAAILARITKRAKIVLLGNVLPIWDDPLWLAETLAEIDMISRGRLVSGWVRGTGRESVAHNAQPPYNWERFQEAHDFVVKAWTDAGPVPLGGRALPLPLREPVGAARTSSRTRRSGSPASCQRNTVEWAAEAPLPVHHARHRARADASSRSSTTTSAPRSTATRPARSTSATCSRCTSTRPRSWPTQAGAQATRGPEQPVPRGQPGQRPAVHPEPAGPDVAHRSSCPPSARFAAAARGARIGINAATATFKPGRLQRLLRAADRARCRIISGTPKTVIPKIRTCSSTLRPGIDLLLGRRRRDGPRRRDALAAAHGRGGHPRVPRDGQGAGPARALRHRPGHEQEARAEAAPSRRLKTGG